MKLMTPLFIFFFSACILTAQEKPSSLPYQEIPSYPENYTPETVVARMVDGLGFRFYWATEGLRLEDLTFKPNEEARTIFETVQHIHGLTGVVLYPLKEEPIVRGIKKPEMDFLALRKATLENLKTASNLLRSGKVKLEDCKIIFQRSETKSEYPFWNNLNGPLADALWHTGQLVSFRRSSGNPFNSKVSVFNGKVRE